MAIVSTVKKIIFIILYFASFPKGVTNYSRVLLFKLCWGLVWLKAMIKIK